MGPITIIIISAGVIALVSATNYLFNNKQNVLRNLKSAGSVSIRDFNHGEIGKIVGNTARYHSVLTAPLSGRKCLYYQVQVERKNDDHWKTIIDDNQCVDFLVKDGIGTALIEAQYIKGYLIKDLNLKSGFWNNPDARMKNYLASKGVNSKGFLGGNKTLRFSEGIIHIGERVAIKGKGDWEMLPDPEEQKLIMKGEPGLELFISDDKSAF